ncbi:MAG: PHP domain-containing protein [Gammaproteobacteria bacterium]|nr:PHP domain-containing protein [Gammaproteobacteria bacterium]
MIDLHCHSHYSDGLLSPKALLERALQSGIKTLALTDHDTLEGVSELVREAQGKAIRIIPGIELSVRWKKYDLHILGLNVSVDSPDLVQLIDKQNLERINRGKAIGAALEGCGIDEAYQKAVALAGHERVGRAHYAQILLKENYVQETKAAFKRYLGKGKVAYVPSSWIDLSEAVATIVAAGGKAVVAHPLKYKLTRTKLHELMQDFKALGGEGIEVVSGAMLDQEMRQMSQLCHRFDLLASSGSDFHGDGMSRVNLGHQKLLPSDCKPIWRAWHT